jgi:hypothetical protein
MSQLLELPGLLWEDIFAPPAEASPAVVQSKSRTMPKQSACRYCGLPVRWEKTARNKKRVPLDLSPTDDPRQGNFVLVDGLAEYVGDQRRLELIRSGVPVFRAHMSSCTRRRAA